MPRGLPPELLDGVVTASGPRSAVFNVKLLNSTRAYVRHFEPTADAVPFGAGHEDDAAEALLVVTCEGGVVRRVTLWAVACDYLRGHDKEWGLEVHDGACESLRDVLSKQANE